MTFRAWQEFRPLFNTFAKTVKPWRKIEATTGAYNDGWNDCVAAMKKAEDGWFKRMDANFKAKIVPISKF